MLFLLALFILVIFPLLIIGDTAKTALEEKR
jgi:hypothetical protein